MCALLRHINARGRHSQLLQMVERQEQVSLRRGVASAQLDSKGEVSEELSEQTGLGKDVAHLAEGSGL